MNQKATEVRILGTPLKVNCPVDEVSALHQAAAAFEGRLQELRMHSEGLSREQLLMFIGLNLCHEMNKMNSTNDKHHNNLHEKIDSLTKKLESALQNRKDV